MKMAAKLAVVDWGVGGVGFLSQWAKSRPCDRVVYFSDSGSVPYGKQKTNELVERLEAIFDYLVTQHGVTHIVVACNAASSVLSQVRSEASFEGVIDLTVSWVKQIEIKGSLVVVGGRGTVQRAVYSQKFLPIKITELVGQSWSALVEQGRLDDEGVELAIDEVLSGLKGEVQLLLACTHYVALKPVIERRFPHIGCLDPIPEVASSLIERWGDLPFKEGEVEFYTTGDIEQTKKAAFQAFGWGVKTIRQCPIDLQG